MLFLLTMKNDFAIFSFNYMPFRICKLHYVKVCKVDRMPEFVMINDSYEIGIISAV